MVGQKNPIRCTRHVFDFHTSSNCITRAGLHKLCHRRRLRLPARRVRPARCIWKSGGIRSHRVEVSPAESLRGSGESESSTQPERRGLLVVRGNYGRSTLATSVTHSPAHSPALTGARGNSHCSLDNTIVKKKNEPFFLYKMASLHSPSLFMHLTYACINLGVVTLLWLWS